MSPVKAKTPGAALMGLSGVYLIENLVNGTPYVGSTQKFNTRWAAHLRLLRRGAHHSWKLQRDFNLFGEAAFNFRPLLVCSVEHLALFEQRALVAYDAVASGYNVSSDVEAPMRGRKHSQEAKEKISRAGMGNQRALGSKSRTGQTNSEEHRQRIAAGHLGKKQTPEFVERRVAPLRGRKGERTHTEETKAKLSKIHKDLQPQRTTQPFAGKTHSEDTRAKMSAARRGVPKSEAHKAALSDAHKGKTHSEEAKALIRRAWEARRLTPVSEETRKKLSEAGKGRGVSEKSRQALIARNKAQAGTKRGPMNLSDEERQRRIDANKARAGKTYEGEQAEDLKAKKQAAWAERKAKGLHTRRWYVARGLEVPSELSTSHPTCEAVASTSTSTSTPQKETF